MVVIDTQLLKLLLHAIIVAFVCLPFHLSQLPNLCRDFWVLRDKYEIRFGQM